MGGGLGCGWWWLFQPTTVGWASFLAGYERREALLVLLVELPEGLQGPVLMFLTESADGVVR